MARPEAPDKVGEPEIKGLSVLRMIFLQCSADPGGPVVRERQVNVAVDAIRVLLADDHHHIRETVRSLLKDKFEVVAAVENGQDAVEAARRLQPDALVLDISMPLLNGLEVARRLSDAGSTTKIIMLTIHEETAFVSAALAAGACGYVSKRMISVDLIPAIRAAAEGRTFISPSIRV